MKVVILAGGGGTRLWPVSRKMNPKQSQPFIGSRTLMQITFARQRKGFRPSDIFVSTNIAHRAAVRKQLPSLPTQNLILETAKRDTAPAIGLAATYLHKKNPKEIMMSVGSDHFIKNEREYVRLLRLAERLVTTHPDYSLLIGVRPTYPETGYGYVRVNKLFAQVGNTEIFYSQRFVEKPDLKTAQRYVRQWDYLWNTNMFCWRVDTLLDLFKRYLPKHYAALQRIERAIGTSRERAVVAAEFARMEALSIDYGIMEKTKKLLVLPASFDWVDVGHWRAIYDILSTGSGHNVARGTHAGVDSSGNLIYSTTGRLVGTVGLRDTVVVDTDDCLLVCPRERAQDVKKLVDELKKKKFTQYL